LSVVGFLLAILQAERLSEQNDLRRVTAFFVFLKQKYARLRATKIFKNRGINI
jgi:hypothetical protein